MDYIKVFEKIALENKITVEEVRREIQDAINEVMNDPDPKVKAFWNSIPHQGETLTPEEAVEYLKDDIDMFRI